MLGIAELLEQVKQTNKKFDLLLSEMRQINLGVNNLVVEIRELRQDLQLEAGSQRYL